MVEAVVESSCRDEPLLEASKRGVVCNVEMFVAFILRDDDKIIWIGVISKFVTDPPRIFNSVPVYNHNIQILKVTELISKVVKFTHATSDPGVL